MLTQHLPTNILGDWHFISDVLSLSYSCILIVHLCQWDKEDYNIILRYAAFSMSWLAKTRDEWDSAFSEFLVILGFVCMLAVRAYSLLMHHPDSRLIKRIKWNNVQIGVGSFVIGSLLFLLMERGGFTSDHRSGRVIHTILAGCINLTSGVAMYHFWSAVPFSKSKQDDLGLAASRFV